MPLDTQTVLERLRANARAKEEEKELSTIAADIVEGIFQGQAIALKAQYEGQIATLTNQNASLTQNLNNKTTENEDLSTSLREKTGQLEAITAELETKTNQLNDKSIELESKTIELETKTQQINTLITEKDTISQLVNAIIDHINSKRDLEALPAITQDTLLEEITALI